jgi:pimeloyl-ACP methyl ester carboxylesterase
MKWFKIALILLLLVILKITIQYFVNNPEHRTLDAAARKLAPGSFVELPGGFTHYEMAGPDTGKVVVLVHGFSVPYYIWDSTFIYLVHQGFKVLRYDEFGRGFSDRPKTDYTAAFLRQQLNDLLGSLKIDTVKAMVGLSFGGPVTSDFVVHFPNKVAQLILVDPLFPDSAYGTQLYPQWIEELKMAINPQKMIAGQLTDLKYPDRFPAWGDQYSVQMAYKGLRHALVSTRHNYASASAIRANYAAVNGLHKPVLLIWGEDDRTTPITAAAALQQVLRVDYFPVPDAAHLPHMEKASVVNEKLRSFLLGDTLHQNL